MKRIKYFFSVFFLLIATLVHAQDLSTIVQEYKTAIGQIEILHCQVEQLDTFVNGAVWHHTGQLSMLRKEGDELFGFQFRAAKGVGGESLYDGLSAFQIDHEKQEYELDPDPQTYILGSPGGQLVIPEMMNYQDPEVTPELLPNDEFFVLRYSYPDLEEYDVRRREKKIFLDKSTFLPVKLIERQETLGKKQVLTRIISDPQINREEDKRGFQKNFLNSYKMVVEDRREDLHADLLNTRVKDFQLTTFSGGQISTQPKAAKLLLLDFWEVWCGPCVQSMPKVQALADTYGTSGLEVVGVLMDPESKDSAERLINKRGIAFTQAFGTEELRSYFRVFAIPQYVLIDQNGTIQRIYRGYDKDMENHIQALLAK